MTRDGNVKLLNQHIKNLTDFKIVKPEIPIPYNHMGATITDAMLQAGTTWKTVVKPRIKQILKYPEARTTTGFFNLIKRIDIKTLLQWNDSEKPNRILKAIDFFIDEKIDTESDLKKWLENDANIKKLKKLRGVRNKTADYFKILSGISTSAVDRHLIEFLRKASIDIRISDYAKAREIVNITAEKIQIDKAILDHSIWKYMSDKNGKRSLCKNGQVCRGSYKIPQRGRGDVFIMESIGSFVKRLSNSINCYYHKTNSGLYSLKKFNTDQWGEMGVFGWVRELKSKNVFELSTYKHLGDRAEATELADYIKDGMHFVSKKEDPDRKGTGIVFYVMKGSNREDYQKSVKSLRAIMDLK